MPWFTVFFDVYIWSDMSHTTRSTNRKGDALWVRFFRHKFSELSSGVGLCKSVFTISAHNCARCLPEQQLHMHPNLPRFCSPIMALVRLSLGCSSWFPPSPVKISIQQLWENRVKCSSSSLNNCQLQHYDGERYHLTTVHCTKSPCSKGSWRG